MNTISGAVQVNCVASIVKLEKNSRHILEELLGILLDDT